MSNLTVYDDVVLYDGDVADWPQGDIGKANVVRLTGSSDANRALTLQKAGFVFADRTLKVTVNLSKCNVDTQRLIRLPVTEECDVKADILNIAAAAFTDDRRFHIREKCDAVIAKKVLTTWVNALDKVLVCRYKNQIIGFLALTEVAADTLFVHLAAVDADYRMTGAAMALYASAIEEAKVRGYKKLQGRISSQNTAVMNIYASFGAMFAEPQDIFIKEISNDAG